ncbi:MAG: hypothetical protein J2P35_06200 [Actinobacteria bacterium]|nr:hypothetical protein [Actinomycetota bacterium]MBO0788423.1 hypothetical protein [Actinomycetota bacterium]
MSQPIRLPGPVPGPALQPQRPRLRRSSLAVAAAVVAGTALLGLAAGYGWAAVAPRALLVMTGHRAAGLINVETGAYFGADVAFCLICLAGGVVSGALGYLLAVRRHGPVAMAGVLAGALAAAFVARWTGQQSGLAAFHHLLATLPPGARLRDALTLRAAPALAAWPLAAGLTAGAIELAVTRPRQPSLPPLD